MRLAFGLLLLVGCDGGSSALSPGTTPQEAVPVSRACVGLPNDGFGLGASMTIDEARILKVSVNYGGGCEEHTFAACWDGAVSKSIPSTFSLTLHHDAHDDLCDAFITRDLFIDLTATPEGFGSPERISDSAIQLTQL